MKFLPALILLLLPGCGIKSFEYNVDGHDAETLASLDTEDIGLLIGADELDTVITAIYDENRNPIKKGNPGIAMELRLQPGTYHFEVRCANTNMTKGGRYNYNRLEVELAPSLSYIAYCVGRYQENSLGERVPVMAVAAISEASKYERDKAKLQARIESQN